MTSTLLDISQVDFMDPEAVDGFAALTVATADRVGMFTSDVASGQSVRDICLSAKDWIYGVEENINLMTSDDRLKLLDSYDWMHRIAYRSPAPVKFLNNHILSAFDARIHGDRTVDEFRLFHSIGDALNRRHDEAYFDKPLKWYSMTLGDWTAWAEEGRLNRLPLHSEICVTSELLGSDLFSFVPRQQDFKSAIAKRLLAKLTATDVIEGLDTPTLLSLFPLNHALLAAGITSGRSAINEPHLRHILSTRPDLHPFHREAFRMG